MEIKQVDIHKFDKDILELMVDTGLPQDNAYNWGLAHASLVLQGVSPAAIVKQRVRIGS